MESTKSFFVRFILRYTNSNSSRALIENELEVLHSTPLNTRLDRCRDLF